MGSTIYVKTKNVYGRELAYPACHQAVKLARLLGVKCFSDNQLRDIQFAGYKVEEDRQVGARTASHLSLVNSIFQGE